MAQVASATRVHSHIFLVPFQLGCPVPSLASGRNKTRYHPKTGINKIHLPSYHEFVFLCAELCITCCFFSEVLSWVYVWHGVDLEMTHQRCILPFYAQLFEVVPHHRCRHAWFGEGRSCRRQPWDSKWRICLDHLGSKLHG